MHASPRRVFNTASRKENGCGTLTMTYVHDPGKVIGTVLLRVWMGSDLAGFRDRDPTGAEAAGSYELR